MCEWHRKLGVALEITSDLPTPFEQDRWTGEPVRSIILPTSIFLTNRKGFPVLSRQHQAFVIKLIRVCFFRLRFSSLFVILDFGRDCSTQRCGSRVILRGRSKFSNGLTPHLEYIRFLYNSNCALTEDEAFEAPYFDHLQAPLQPLMDNLESSTYETFEKDPIKYRQYEQAVFRALLDRFAADQTAVVMVVGAGRGPLVQCVLNAAQRASRTVRVFAVEKNPNAVITLRGRRANEWGDRVTIVAHDMRTWQAPELCDILVSELLGSFGDNELSPECLDGAQRFLKPDGISIPQDYVSFLSPISTPRLWNELSVQGGLKPFETPYVVKLHNFFEMAPAQQCFKFEHPIGNLQDKTRNTRYRRMRFTVPQAATLHGFAGYFDSKLYDDVHISILPATFSEGMFSWFPLYFPLRTPVYVSAQTELCVDMWRVVSESSGRVWFEWALVSPTASPLHNPNGRSYWIGL
jgi:protein arginine N-methyltransferase 5